MGAVRQPTPMFIRRRQAGDTPTPEPTTDLIKAQSWLPLRYGNIWYTLHTTAATAFAAWADFEIDKVLSMHEIAAETDTSTWEGTLHFYAQGTVADREIDMIAIQLTNLAHAHSRVGTLTLPMMDLIIDWQGGIVIDQQTYVNKALFHVPSPGEYIRSLLVPALESTPLSVNRYAGPGRVQNPPTDAGEFWDRFGASTTPLIETALTGPLGTYDIEIEVKFNYSLNVSPTGSFQYLTPTETRIIKNGYTPA